MDIVIMAGQLMLSLSILIVLHEMGHFFPARWFNTRVEKFYLFFDPYFSLIKKKIGDTEYGIGWLPLGGYVKISGMVDESFDREQMKEEPKEWEFRSKPAWQRLIIMLGGVTVNFILGFLLYGLVLWQWGEEFLPNEQASYGIYADSLGLEMGLEHGDKIVRVGELPFEKFNDRTIIREIVINNVSQLTVERGGIEVDLSIDPKFVGILSSHEYKNAGLFTPGFPFVVAEVTAGMPAAKAGLLPEDMILAIDSVKMPFYIDFYEAMKKYPSQEVTLTVLRGGTDTLNLTLLPTEESKIGVLPLGPNYFFEMEREEYSLAAALPAGFVKGANFLNDQFKAFGQMFRGKIKASESLGGFGSIGKMFGAQWNWERFWTMTAVLSLILAFMNLLPIPALDGGHVLFLLYEIVSGRKPSDKFMEVATMVGFAIVLGLVIYANGLDILRGFFGK
jgi:regulator of sigma E protease